jgi:hypothetical protein
MSAEKPRAGVRQTEVIGGPQDQLNAEKRLHLRELMAGGWLGYANRLCGGLKRAALGDPHE